MRKQILAVFLGLNAAAACHADTTRTWAMSGSDLARALEGKMPTQFHESETQRQFSSAYGQAYILGVADDTRGTRWCSSTGILPHEMADRVYTYLSGLSAEQLRGNAASLVGEALQKELPCSKP